MRKLFATAALCLLVCSPGLAAPSPQPDLQKRIELGDRLAGDERLNEALDQYLKAIHQDPSNATAHERAGRTYAAMHKVAQAIAELRNAIKLDPKNVAAHCELGMAYGMQGEYRSAANEERAAIALDPKLTAAYINLGVALAKIEQFPPAAAAFQQAIELDPQSVDAYLNLASLWARLGDYKNAIALYRKALAIDATNASAHLGLGAALSKTGDHTAAISELKVASTLAPRNAVIHGRLGWVFYENGDWIDALKEGYMANGLRLQQSSGRFFGFMVTTWAALFLVFGAIFGAVFLGSRFTAQPNETLIRSFFLVFYKEKPGRFVVTDRRLVFVPEAFSQWFGATRLSIEQNQVDSFKGHYGVRGGHLAVLCTSGTVYHFAMPALVLEPLLQELEKLTFAQGPQVPEPALASVASATAGSGAAPSGGDAAEEPDNQEVVTFVDYTGAPPSLTDPAAPSATEPSLRPPDSPGSASEVATSEEGAASTKEGAASTKESAASKSETGAGAEAAQEQPAKPESAESDSEAKGK